ncbi:hypothetical protein C8Q78DRAFT_1047035 [Trametes maxima]|nr:hypothetical protein C8Q78DRAFT_1047035 [Trametes maxima]
MKFFSVLPTLAVAMLGALHGVVAQDSGAVISAIQTVTTASSNLQVVVDKTTITNVAIQAPKILGGFKDIVTTVTRLTATVIVVSDPKPFSDDVAVEVVNQLRNFVTVHQLLLNTLIGKHSLLARFGPTAPLAAVLRSLESVVDTFAFGIIDLIPTRRDEGEKQVNELNISLTAAVQTYES